MSRLALCTALGCVFVLGLAAAHAQEEPLGANSSAASKRQFVRTQMIREFADSLDARLLAEIDGKVNAMSPQRLDQLVKMYQKRNAPAETQTAQAADDRLAQLNDPAYRQMLIDAYKARLAAARSGGNPGFAPVITTLPSGTQLGASAVVSPDRRYVRMSLTPFFSSVGPVQTFTFQNPSPYQPHPVAVPLRP